MFYVTHGPPSKNRGPRSGRNASWLVNGFARFGQRLYVGPRFLAAALLAQAARGAGAETLAAGGAPQVQLLDTATDPPPATSGSGSGPNDPASVEPVPAEPVPAEPSRPGPQPAEPQSPAGSPQGAVATPPPSAAPSAPAAPAASKAAALQKPDIADKLQPEAEPSLSSPIEMEASGLRGVTPGASTVDDLQRAWGMPKDTHHDGKVTAYLVRDQALPPRGSKHGRQQGAVDRGPFSETAFPPAAWPVNWTCPRSSRC